MTESLQLNPSGQSGLNLFAVWTDPATGNVWSGAAWSAYSAANLIAGAVAGSEQGTTAQYLFAVTAGVLARNYAVAVYVRAGGSPATGDLAVAPLGYGRNATLATANALDATVALADVQTIKTQAVTCSAGVTIAPFVGNSTAALAVDASGRIDLGKILGTASVGTAGYMAPDWGHVNAPTTTVGLTGTTISTGQVVASVSGAVGSVTGNVGGSVASVVGLTASNLDAAVTTRMATYAQPTGFLAATFPTGTIASTTNITAGTITTVTTLTNLPTAPTDWITAAAVSAGAVTKIQAGLSTATSAQIATAVWQDTTSGDFTVAGSIGKSLFTSGAVPGAAGGHFIAGSNAATTVNITGTISTVTAVTNAVTITANQAVNAAQWGGVSVTGMPMPTYTQPTGFLATTFAGTVGTSTFATGGSVNATQLSGQTITAAAGVTFPTSIASPTNITAGTITTVTNLTNAPTSGDFTATMKTSLNAATPVATLAVGSIATATFAAGATIPRVTLVDTVTTYTGNTPQTGDSFARIGGTGSGLTSLAPSSTALSTVQWSNTLATNLGVTNSTVATNLNGTITGIPAAVDTTLTASHGAGVWGGDGGYTGTAQGGTSTTITLASSASATNSTYVGQAIVTNVGLLSQEVRQITAYVGSTKVATVNSAWVSNPTNSTTYNLPGTNPAILRNVVVNES